jgi:hypothetical protein
LIYNLPGESLQVSQSGYRQFTPRIIIASMIPYLFLGVYLLARIYLNGYYNISAHCPRKVFISLDFIIILTAAICFDLAFLLICCYFFYLRWYRRSHRRVTVILPKIWEQGLKEETAGENGGGYGNNKE